MEILEPPDKSENDNKEYKILKLPNGIKVFIASDPSPIPDSNSSLADFSSNASSCEERSSGSSTSSSSSEEEVSIESTSTERESSSDDCEEDEGDEKLAACALMIDVGSFSDPNDIQGLSHFLEHMIFMGSEKFPEENAFDSHIKKCGGFDNADTECEETSFYFEVPDDDLESSIERFTALFKAPLMKKEAMTRERMAVESEFQSTVQEDESRRDQILASLGNESHPCRIFTWGNLETLNENIKDDELHKRLREFQKKHYSAHRMYVAIQARLPLERIEQIVVKHFSDISKNDLPGNDFTEFNYKNAFKDIFYDQVYFVKPVSNVHKLELTWCLPPLLDDYRCKPHHYLAHLIGYEGCGSLCAYLRQKLWALELIAGIGDSGFEFNSMYSLFNICIYLTEDGFEHLNEVLSVTYSYIKLLNQWGPNKILYEELQYLEETKFRFQNEQSAFDNVQDFVLNLKYYPSKYVLTGPELFFEYNEESILKLIKYLNNEKFNIMITSKITYPGIKYDKKEKWFGTEYTSINIPDEWIKLWNNAESNTELYFPQENKFIAKDFKILDKCVNNCNDLTTTGSNNQYPKKIMESDVFELWYRQDDKFLLPEAYMYFYFMTPLPLQSAKTAALLTVYTLFIKYHLAEELYPATIAGLSNQFYAADKGIILKVNGYNEKMPLIVDVITKTMKKIGEKMTEEQLKVFLKQQQKNYFNTLIKPKTLNKDLRLEIIEQIRWPMYQKYNALNDITLDDVKTFSNDILIKMRIQSIIQGNVSEETAHNVMNLILTNLNCCAIKNLDFIESRTHQLPKGSNYLIVKSLNENDVNTVVCNFYQIGPCKLSTECYLDLLMMFVEEPLFDILRTKEQLGYDVSSSVRNNYGILGYTITINSQEDKFSSSFVDNRIETFQGEMLKIILNLEIAEFEQVKESLIKTKQIIDNELKDEVNRNWSEITSNEYIFDRPKREIEFLKNVTKKNIIDFLREIEENNFRKLSIQVVGNANVKTSKLDNVLDDSGINNILTSNLDFIPNDSDEILKEELKLEFIMDEKSTITDINTFKTELFLYPVSKTIFEDNQQPPIEKIIN